MNAPGGTILVAIVGLIVAGAGIMQMRKGWKEDFRKHLQAGAMRSEPKQWAVRAGKWGYIARGVVFLTIGLFVVSAAMRHDPNRARGIEGALDALAAQPYGQWLLGLVAAGLVCYGAYCFVEARYRHLHV
jgi:hypothetical protein